MKIRVVSTIEIYEKQYKIGYTTGVFDMFHIGHLNMLMMLYLKWTGRNSNQCIAKLIKK